MEGLIKLAVLVLSELQATERMRAGATRTTAAAVCIAIASIAGISALGCAAAGVWIYLLPSAGPVESAFLTALFLLAIAAVLLLVARSAMRSDEGLAPRRDGEALLGEMRGMFQRHKSSSLMAALLAGLAAGTRKR